MPISVRTSWSHQKLLGWHSVKQCSVVHDVLTVLTVDWPKHETQACICISHSSVFDWVEQYAPGFKSSVVGRDILTPPDLERIFGLTGGVRCGLVLCGGRDFNGWRGGAPLPIHTGSSTLGGRAICIPDFLPGAATGVVLGTTFWKETLTLWTIKSIYQNSLFYKKPPNKNVSEEISLGTWRVEKGLIYSTEVHTACVMMGLFVRRICILLKR